MFKFRGSRKRKTQEVIERFLKSYAQNEKSVNKKEIDVWLKEQLVKELPEKTQEEIEVITKELMEGVAGYHKHKKKVEAYQQAGFLPSDYLKDEIVDKVNRENISMEELKATNEALTIQNETLIYEIAGIEEPKLVEKILEAKENEIEEAEIINIIEKENTNSFNNDLNSNLEKNSILNTLADSQIAENYLNIMSSTRPLNYVDTINTTIDSANKSIKNVIFTKEGKINQNPNLDGFLFEEHHAATFNIDAAVKDKTNLQAEAFKPKEGATFGKNSVDLGIKDNGKIVRKYQAKLCKTTKDTLKAFSNHYHWQRKLVGSDQVNKIPNSTDKISYNGVESKATTKVEQKVIQEEVQKGNVEATYKTFEHDVSNLGLAKQIGKQAILNGSMGLATGMAFDIGKKIIKGEDIEVGEVIEAGVKTGVSNGMSTAIAGGIKVSVEKKYIPSVVGKFLNNKVIGTVSASVLNIIRVGYKLGKGEISLGEGLSEIGLSIAATYAMSCVSLSGIVTGGASIIATVGAILTTAVPVVATAICTYVGVKVAKPIVKGLATVGGGIVKAASGIVKASASAVTTLAKGAWSGVKAVGSAVVGGVKAVASGVGTVVSGVCSAVGSVVGGFFGW